MKKFILLPFGVENNSLFSTPVFNLSFPFSDSIGYDNVRFEEKIAINQDMPRWFAECA